MRFCLDLSHHPWNRAGDPAAAATATLAAARAADEAGIDAIWVSEDPDGWDATTLLGALAAVTASAELGTGVTSPYPRHPNQLAAAVATLDRLSGGRAVLGLGRGEPEWHAGPLGVAVGSPLAALEATITLLRQWWQPPHRASSHLAGSPFRVDDWERTVHPLRQPPILLAAAGPRALALAGRLADGVIFNALTSDEFLAEAIPAVRAAARAAGRDPALLRFVLRTAVFVSDDPESFLERQKTLIALVNTLPGMERLLRLDGHDLPAMMAQVRRAMRTEELLASGAGFPALRRGGDLTAARAAIPTEVVARLAIAGPLAEAVARLRRLAALGISDVSLAPPPEPTAAAYSARLRQLRAALSAPPAAAPLPS